MKQKLIKLIKQTMGIFPSRLPVGVTEFNAWAQDIINTYDLPTQDQDSVKFTLSTVIMHLGPQADYKAKYFFVKTMRAAAAKQVAGQVFSDIKLRQKEAEAKRLAEAQKADEPAKPQAIN